MKKRYKVLFIILLLLLVWSMGKFINESNKSIPIDTKMTLSAINDDGYYFTSKNDQNVTFIPTYDLEAYGLEDMQRGSLVVITYLGDYVVKIKQVAEH